MNTHHPIAEAKTPSRFTSCLILITLLITVILGGMALLLASKTTVPGTRLVYSIEPNENVLVQEVAEPIRRRLRSLFKTKLTVNTIDDKQVEILLPTQDATRLQVAKDLLATGGVLRFLIVANPFRHQSLISLAKSTAGSPAPNVLDDQGYIVGRWVTIGREATSRSATRPLRVALQRALLRNSKTGEIISLPDEVLQQESDVQIALWMDGQSIKSIDVLMAVDPLGDIGGEDLSFVASTYDQNGSPALAFDLTDSGGTRFFDLTTNNRPNGSQRNQLGIVLDDQLLSAPTIQSPIREEGRITGNFSEDEVNRMVQILKAGQLPTALGSQPLSESKVDIEVRLLDSLLP